MFIKLSQQNINNVMPGDVLYYYPLSGVVVEQFKEEEIENIEPKIVATISPIGEITFQKKAKLIDNLNSLVIFDGERKKVEELTNGLWWIEIEEE